MTDLLATGTILENRYQIIDLLGEGGMGAVYRAWDLRLSGHIVAVKENFAATAQTQFQTEAAILAKLNHPALPRVTNYFIEPQTGRQYLVMDYIEGNDLEKHVAKYGRVPEAQAVGWITEVLSALDYMHTQRPPIIHRDIKPANIKIRPDGKAVLVDFGIAKLFDPTQKTQTSIRGIGSPGFAPLEQYGRGSTDPRSDVYALGATLYFMLTAQVPPEATDIAAGVRRPSSLSVLGASVSAHVEQAITRAMMIDANQRFQSAREFCDALAGKAVRQPAASNPLPTANVYVPTHTPMSNPQVASGTMPQARSFPPSLSYSNPSLPMTNIQYASWGRRAVAYIIDYILIYVASLPFSLTAQVMDAAASSSYNSSSTFLLMWNCVQAILIPVGYVICYTQWGKTIGKKIMGIQVVSLSNYRPPTIGWSIVRILVYGIESALCLILIGFIGFLLPLWDAQKQTIHDKVANTIVIRV